MFFWTLEVAVVNAYIIYKMLAVRRGKKPISSHAFRQRLIESLAEPISSSVIPWARSGPNMVLNIERLRSVRHCISRVVHYISHTMSVVYAQRNLFVLQDVLRCIIHTSDTATNCIFCSVTNVCQSFHGFILCIHAALYPTLIS